jgi:hypothetical protein
MVELQIGAALREPAVARAAVKASAIVALTAALCAIVGYVNLAASFDRGQLSVPPLYDDVSYFVDAARWLSAAPVRSLAANLYALLDQHAPFTTLTSAIGLSVVPRGYVGPYLVNVVLVATFMLAIAGLVWHVSIVDIATCLIGLACIPMLGQTMTEGRPDLPWGLALGLALGAIFYRPLYRRSYGSLIFLGLLCGAAAALKPTALPASVAFIIFAVCAATLCGCLESKSRDARFLLKQASATLLLFGLGFFLAVAAIDGVGLADTIRYIMRTMIYVLLGRRRRTRGVEVLVLRRTGAVCHSTLAFASRSIRPPARACPPGGCGRLLRYSDGFCGEDVLAGRNFLWSFHRRDGAELCRDR